MMATNLVQLLIKYSIENIAKKVQNFDSALFPLNTRVLLRISITFEHNRIFSKSDEF